MTDYMHSLKRQFEAIVYPWRNIHWLRNELNKNKSYKQIAQEQGISRGTIEHWAKKYQLTKSTQSIQLHGKWTQNEIK